MHRHVRQRESGQTPLMVLVGLGILALIVVIILDVIALFRAPSSISTPTQVSRTALPDGGAVIIYSTTVNYDTARTATVTEEGGYH